MIGARTRARELALQALYSFDVQDVKDPSLPGTTVDHAEASAEVKAFARELSEGVVGRLAELDELIRSAAENWDIGRLAVVDRNVLRLALYEMLARDDIPAKVSINEAIELGKRYSTAQSGGFINGILDRVRRDLGLPASEGDDEDADSVADEAAPTDLFLATDGREPQEGATDAVTPRRAGEPSTGIRVHVPPSNELDDDETRPPPRPNRPSTVADEGEANEGDA